MTSGVMVPTEEGTPQGGPLFPLLSNIVLDELDKELEKRGHRYVRYADDFMIFCKNRKAAEPPWYAIRMPGGVGGLLSDGESYPDYMHRLITANFINLFF
jgi:hypothetical protein